MSQPGCPCSICEGETVTDLKTRIAEAIFNSEYNLRYHRIDMWGAYQYANSILTKLEIVEDWHGKATHE